MNKKNPFENNDYKEEFINYTSNFDEVSSVGYCSITKRFIIILYNNYEINKFINECEYDLDNIKIFNFQKFELDDENYHKNEKKRTFSQVDIKI